MFRVLCGSVSFKQKGIAIYVVVEMLYDFTSKVLFTALKAQNVDINDDNFNLYTHQEKLTVRESARCPKFIIEKVSEKKRFQKDA